MMLKFLSNFQFDRLSFWLGFLAASIFWWLFTIVRRHWPGFQTRLRQQIDTARRQRATGLGEKIRRETLKQAQAAHIASALFSLDEIIVPPVLLAPPQQLDPNNPILDEDSKLWQFPYLPDWPELSAEYGQPKLSIAQCLDSRINLAIIGQPGCGKTVALANLASQISRHSPEAGLLRNHLPLFFHIANLDLPLEVEKLGSDPLPPIIKAASNLIPIMSISQLPGFLTAAFEQDNVCLMIDGLDELPPSQLQVASTYLSILMGRYSDLQIIVSASPDYFDGLVSLGFFPIALAPWTSDQRQGFVNQWSKLWVTHIQTQENDGTEIIDPILLNNWTIGTLAQLTPLEATLKIWAAYAGDVRGSSVSDSIESYLSRVNPEPNYRLAIEKLAHQIIFTGQPVLAANQAGALISTFITPDGAEFPAAEYVETETPDANLKSENDPQASQVKRAIPMLIDEGILKEYSNNRVSFTHPVITAYLASRAVKPSDIMDLMRNYPWALALTTLRFMSHRIDLTPVVKHIISQKDTPLYRNQLIVSRWLKDTPETAPWRSSIMRFLVEIMQNEALSFSSKARAVAAFVWSDDPSARLLFRQLLNGPSPHIKQLAAIGCGALQDTKAGNELVGLLSDPDNDVRQAACAALGAIGDDAAINAISKVLLTADENLRRMAAEALTNWPNKGYPMLEKAYLSDDLLVRRAVVYAYRKINQPWTAKLLEKMGIEDGQWIVRNAASQALENSQKPDMHTPRQLPHPWESPWLVTFAGQHGQGISAGDPATNMLMEALKTGTLEEMILALDYLTLDIDPVAIHVIKNVAASCPPELQDRIFYSLWLLNLKNLPPT